MLSKLSVLKFPVLAEFSMLELPMLELPMMGHVTISSMSIVAMGNMVSTICSSCTGNQSTYSTPHSTVSGMPIRPWYKAE